MPHDHEDADHHDETVELGLATNQQLFDELSARFDTVVVAYSVDLSELKCSFGLVMEGCPAASIGLFRAGLEVATGRLLSLGSDDEGENDVSDF